MSQCNIHANLVKIHPLVHEIWSKKERSRQRQKDPHQKLYVPLPFGGEHNYDKCMLI